MFLPNQCSAFFVTLCNLYSFTAWAYIRLGQSDIINKRDVRSCSELQVCGVALSSQALYCSVHIGPAFLVVLQHMHTYMHHGSVWNKFEGTSQLPYRHFYVCRQGG